MKVVLLRHGPTLWNEQGRYMGRTDLPLSGGGEAFVRQQPVYPRVKRVYTSGLQRTSQTAKILFPQAELYPVEELNEIDFGVFEGKTADEMENWESYRAWVDGYCEGPIPEGETKAGFTNRCCSAFESIVEDRQQDEELTFVLHGGAIRAIMSRYAQPGKAYFEWHVPHCGGFEAQLHWKPEWKLTQAVARLPLTRQGTY